VQSCSRALKAEASAQAFGLALAAEALAKAGGHAVQQSYDTALRD